MIVYTLESAVESYVLLTMLLFEFILPLQQTSSIIFQNQKDSILHYISIELRHHSNFKTTINNTRHQ